jgi:elongation factor 3
MSPAAAPTLSTPIPEGPFTAELTSLATAASNAEAKSIADGIALSLKKSPQTIEAIQDGKIIDLVLAWAGSKSGYERESAPVLVERICKSLGTGVEAVFVPVIPALLNLAMDKGQPVRSAVNTAMTAMIKAAAPEGSRPLLEMLTRVLDEAKGWRTKVAALKAIEGTVKQGAEEYVAAELGRVIPYVEAAMHDTKQEVSAAANKAATTLCSTLPNPDVLKHIALMVSAMASPTAVPGTIKALSSTTFVAEVTGPTLAVMVPLLTRALKERSTDTQRMTCVVIGNLVKLVRDPLVAARYLSPLVSGVQQIAEGAAFPEIRAFAQTALDILHSAGASASATPLPPRDVILSVTEALTVMIKHLGIPGLPSSPSLPLSASLPWSPIVAHSIEYQANVIADLVEIRRFDASVWEGKGLGSFMKLLLGTEKGAEATAAIRQAFLDLDKAKYAPPEEDDGSEGQLLCDIQFSLAYGGLLLLNHTNLKLRRGRRYGICAANGAGKSTLMKAIRDQKVEGFPSQDELRCLMVEHALQGEDTSMAIVDFVAADKKLAGKAKKEVADMLLSVGFSEEKQQDPVASLSGGWKMKLELARAMLIGADILLLDEPTNHLGMSLLRALAVHERHC